MQQGAEALELVGCGALGQVHAVEARLDQAAVLFVAQVVARHRDDAPPLGQRPVAECLEQRRHELAPGQVTGAAEQNEVKTHGMCLRVSGRDCNLVT